MSRTTARAVPSGDQSASWTPSITSRGAAPSSGMRASVPALSQPMVKRRRSDSASSPRDEMPSTSAPVRPSARDSRESRRAENTSGGVPSQAAPYTTVPPSGAKRAVNTEPRLNVSGVRRTSSTDVGDVLRPIRNAPAATAASAPATAAGTIHRGRADGAGAAPAPRRRWAPRAIRPRRCRAGDSSGRARGSAAAGGAPRRSAGRQARPVDLVLEHVGEHVGDQLAGEEPGAGEHLEQHDAERPDVGTPVDRLAARLLGRHVGGGAEDHADLGRGGQRRRVRRVGDCAWSRPVRGRAPSRDRSRAP